MEGDVDSNTLAWRGAMLWTKCKYVRLAYRYPIQTAYPRHGYYIVQLLGSRSMEMELTELNM